MLFTDSPFFDAIVIVFLVAGGMLGARLARAPAWKGGVIAFAASLVQIAAGTMLGIENAIVLGLVYLLAVGLIGGRFGLKLSARQMGPVVIGSFLVPVAVILAYIAIVVGP